MSHIILQPTADKEAKIHYLNTVRNPIVLSLITSHLDASTGNKIERLYPSGYAPVWGVTNGKKNGNYNKWCKGDRVISLCLLQTKRFSPQESLR